MLSKNRNRGRRGGGKRPLQGELPAFTKQEVQQIFRLAKNAGSKGLITKSQAYINKVKNAGNLAQNSRNTLKLNAKNGPTSRRRRRNGQRNQTTNRGPVNAPSEQIRKEGFKVDNVNHPKKVYLNPSDYTVNTTNLPMIEVLRVQPRLDVSNFLDTLWGVGAMALAQGIAPGKTTMVDSGPVPTLWFFVLCLAYDLWYAMQGQFSFFKKAPVWYWEIRTAVMPVERGKVVYQFSVPQEFFGIGGLLPTGLPLERDAVSLTSYAGSGPLQNLNSTPPTVTTGDLDNYISDVCSSVFKDMERLSDACAIIDDNTASNPYKKAVGVFAAHIIDDPVNDPLFAWSRFYIEVPVSPWEYWLMYLGWGSTDSQVDDTTSVVRTGQYIQQEFQSGCNLTGRILRGMVGKLPAAHWRVKTVFMEQIMWALAASLVAADEFYNDQFGVVNINNTTWTKSMLANITPAYFVTVMGVVMRRVMMTNAAFYDNPQSNMSVWAGIKFYAGPYDTVQSLPRFLVESMADLAEICVPTKQMGDIHIVTIFGSGGNFGINPYNNGGANQYDLTSLASALYPSNPAASYLMDSTPVFGMWDYVNVDDFTRCNFIGDAIPDAEESVQDIMVGLTGNLSFQPGSSHTNASTLAYYTLVLTPPLDTKIEIDPRPKKVPKGEEKLPFVGGWTSLYNATVTNLINAFPFSPDQVSYDLTRILPVTFVPINKWIPIFRENYTMPGGVGQMTLIQDWLVTNSKDFAHPLSTIGGQEQDQMLLNNVSQNLDGGFDFLKNLMGPVVDMFMPGVGGMISGLLGSE